MYTDDVYSSPYTYTNIFVIFSMRGKSREILSEMLGGIIYTRDYDVYLL